jgi:hypothetical protein
VAENKREDWEIDRDREEIAALLSRYPQITHKRIADTLNRRRDEEYRAEVERLGRLGDDEPIPDVRPPYSLTRQMIDYDVKAIRRAWRKDYAKKFDDHISEQLARAKQLHADAYEGYERTQGEFSGIEENRETVELKTTVAGLIDALGDDNEKLLGGLLSTKDLTRKVTLPGATRVRFKRKKEKLIGDPRYLLVADRAEARIDKLLGLEAPTEIDVKVKTREALAALLGVTPDDLPDAGPDGAAK